MGKWVRECLNWKKVMEERYNKAFGVAPDKRKDKMSSVRSQEQPTREAIEDTANTTREAHYDVVKKMVPVANMWRGDIIVLTAHSSVG